MMTTMMNTHNEYNAGARFLAQLTPKEQTIITPKPQTNSLEKKGPQMYWEWNAAKPVHKKHHWRQPQEDSNEQNTQWIDKVWMNLAKQASQGVLQQHMTKLDAMVWVRHGIKTLDRIVNNEKPTARQALILQNTTLLHSFAWLMRHPVPASIMLDDDLKYFEKLGKIFQTGATIAPTLFRQIGVALIDALVKCATKDMDCKSNNVFEKLESTGWLELYLVWASDKITTISNEKSNTLDLLKACTSFVRKSFPVGTPCGKEVRAIVKKCDLFQQCRVALSCYNDLIQISESVSCAYKYCDISGSRDKMLYCGKCRKVCYCCKECQTAAWFGEHNVMCCVPIFKIQNGLEFVHDAMHQHSNELGL